MKSVVVKGAQATGMTRSKTFDCYIPNIKPLLNWRHYKHLSWAKKKKEPHCCTLVLVHFSDESKCCISFRKQHPRVRKERGTVENVWSPVWSFHMLIWGVSSCCCCFWSKVSAAVYQEGNFMMLSTDKLHGDVHLFFQQNLVPAHSS